MKNVKHIQLWHSRNDDFDFRNHRLSRYYFKGKPLKMWHDKFSNNKHLYHVLRIDELVLNPIKQPKLNVGDNCFVICSYGINSKLIIQKAKIISKYYYPNNMGICYRLCGLNNELYVNKGGGLEQYENSMFKTKKQAQYHLNKISILYS